VVLAGATADTAPHATRPERFGTATAAGHRRLKDDQQGGFSGAIDLPRLLGEASGAAAVCKLAL